MKKPNIVFFFTDDQRFDTIAALGNKEISTPNLDWLVNRGTSFTNAHIPSGTSGAVCMPSRAMLHTGRTLFHIDGEGQSIPAEHTLLGEFLQQNGYRTFGTGKWHNGTESYARSFTDGDEIFFGGMQDHWNVPAHRFDPTGKYDSRSIKIDDCFFKNEEHVYICDHVTPGKHSSELFCETTARFIKNYTDDKPYFAYVSFMAPHDPRTMPKRFKEMYDPAKIKLPNNFMAQHPIEYGNTSIRDEVLAAYPRDKDEVKKHIAEYYGMISHLDDEVGKVIEVIKEKGELENTLFIFAGDNGLAVGQHGLMGKQSHFEHSIRVPLILAGPGVPQGTIRDQYVYLLDIFPSICDILELQAPKSVEGRSFTKCFEDEKHITRDTLYFAYTNKIRSVKDSQYKLMEFVHDGLLTTRLYDIINDPFEMADLSQQSQYTSKIKELRSKLYDYREAWDDTQPKHGEIFWSNYETLTK